MNDAAQSRSAGGAAAPAWAGGDTRLAGIGGEFRSGALETAFQAEQAPETLRHSRFVLIASAVLNALFLISDWRFAGTPHFWIAVPARIGVVLVALAGLALIARFTAWRAVQRIMLGWMLLTALGVGLLVTSHSDIALFVAIMLPSIYYFTVPVTFRHLLAGGLFCSLAMLAGYGDYGGGSSTALGLGLAMVILNTALALSVTRANRLARLAWLATEGQRRLSVELDRSRAMFERMFAACPVPLILTAREDGMVVRMSDSCQTLLRTAQPATLRQFYAAPDAPDGLTAALDAGGGEAEYEALARLPGGIERTLLIKAAALTLDGRDLVMSGLLDITERKAAQTSLEHLASTDALTGLANRLSFFAAARAEMLRATRGRTALTLLMVDIDHFKAINDTHGHQAGDATLRAFAAACLEQLGVRAVIGRLGGEEFGVLLPHTGIEAAALIAETLRAAIAATTVTAGTNRAIRMTVSIGVARVRADDRDIDGALARADLALYTAKRGGRDRVVVDETGTTKRRSA